MLTIEGQIAVISLCLTCFGLGYTIGNHKTQNNRPVLRKQAVILVIILFQWTNRLSVAPFL